MQLKSITTLFTKTIQFLCVFTIATTIAINSHAQQIPCPPNIDFEFGSLLLWECEIGTSQTGTTQANFTGATTVLPIPGTHDITSGGGTDPYGGFPVVCPIGGNYSLRLGNNSSGQGAERVKYYLQVPAGINNYTFTFQYAVVLQDPNHSPNQQPRFEVNAYDSATGLPVPCAQQSFIAAASIPGFFTSPLASDVRYKPWTSAILSVGGTAGQTIILTVASLDCTLGAHFGYGYFDLIDCGQFVTAIASCDLDGQGIVLTGPPGYMTYEWWDENFTTIVDTGMVATYYPTTTTPQFYNLVMTPYPSVSTCKDTIQTLPIANIDVQALPDTACITPNIPIQLQANATGGVGNRTYTWQEFGTPGNTLSCTTCENPIATPTGSSFYTVKVSDTNGCYRTDTLQVLYSVFTPDAGNDFTTCVGTPITFNASVTPQSSAFTYKWTPNTDLNFDTLLQPTMTPTAEGTIEYVLSVDSLACTKTDTMSVTVLPNDIFIQDTTICKGQVVRVNALGDANFTYSWSPSIGLSDPTIVDPIITTDTSRTYIVTASYPGCPTIVKTYNVKVEPMPVVSLPADTSKCEFEDLFISSMVTPAWYQNYTYQWIPNYGLNNDNTPNVIFTGAVDTTLALYVTTPVGCSDSENIRIVVHPGNFASITPASTAICPNDSVNINITGGQYFTWDPPSYISDTTIGNVVSTPVGDISYTIYVMDQFGCSDTLTTSIDVHADAVLDAGNNITLYPGDTAQLNPTGNCLYYQWFPPQGLSSTTVANPLASPSVNTRYYVTGTTENGCTVLDSVDVIVSTESMLAMPNAFTPGNSGMNTTIKLVRRGEADLKSLRIYDRWGTMVFETNNINEGWDGKYKGTPQPMGVYIYMVEAVKNGRKFYKQGNITLIR